MRKNERKLLITYCRNAVEQRKQSGKSQEDLAKYCGVSKSSVSKWENGTTRPSLCQLPKIADFYKITIQKLLTGKEKYE